MIPHYIRNHEAGLKNFSLHFQKFSRWENDKANIEHHISVAPRILACATSALQDIHTHQSATLRSIAANGGFFLELTAKLATPYVSGLGGNHPSETGFILDRNTGLPYIPASGIKGVLRLAHALNLAKPDMQPNRDGDYEISDREPTLRKYFGDTDTAFKDAVRGQLVFLDAFPLTVPTMKKDIMNPHFAGYYKGDNPPLETESPIPVMFMSVKEGVEFRFRIFAAPLAEGCEVDTAFGDEDKRAIIAMFSRATEELGFGAKTAVGYGRFAGLAETSDRMREEWQKVALAEENSRYPWRAELRTLEAVTSWGDLRQRVLDNSGLADYRTEPEVFNAVYNKASSIRKSWKKEDMDERDRIVAVWLEPSGLTWPPAEAATASVASDAGAELERIRKMAKWADYLADPVNIDLLSRNGLKVLREKLKGWGCEDKNAKEDKKEAWEVVNRKLKG